MNRIGIVIVTYNSESVIAACLRRATTKADRVVVVDNASSDRTLRRVERFQEVDVIANSANRGYAAAVNQGASALECEFILLLNPDVELYDNLDLLVEACRQTTVGAAAGKLLDTCGHPQTGFNVRRLPTPAMLACEVLGLNRLWSSNPVNRRYRVADFDPDTDADIEQPPGAFVMIRRDVWNSLGGMDEQFYPLWFEDVDLMRRLSNLRYRVRYVPQVTARHHGAHSIRQLSFRCRQLYWYDSLLRYASKHYGPGEKALLCITVAFAALLRTVTTVFCDRRMEGIGVYVKVIRIALRCLLRGPVRRMGAVGTVRETITVRTEE